MLAKTIYEFSPCLHRNVTSSICSAEFKNINMFFPFGGKCLSASLLQPRRIVLIELAKRPNRANSLSSTSFRERENYIKKIIIIILINNKSPYSHRHNHDRVVNKNGKVLLQLCQSLGLYIINCRLRGHSLGINSLLTSWE